jgi:hypothetical protein
MGVLTNDMRRLRGEADAMRGRRSALIDDLALGARQLHDLVTTMQAGFHKTHSLMAENDKTVRAAFIANMVNEVAAMKTGVAAMKTSFRVAHAQMARKARNARLAFVSGHKRVVANLRRAISTDLAGAHRIWFGSALAAAHAEKQAAKAESRHMEADRPANDDAAPQPRATKGKPAAKTPDARSKSRPPKLDAIDPRGKKMR